MRRCVPVALLAFGPLACGPTTTAMASQTRYHVGHRVYGCVDPQAAVALNGPQGRRATARWIGWVRQNGRCFAFEPTLQIDVISRRAGMALVRRVPPRIGEPPVFVLERDVQVLQPEAGSSATALPGQTMPAAPPAGAPAQAPHSAIDTPVPAAVTAGDGGPSSSAPTPDRVGDTGTAIGPEPGPGSGSASGSASRRDSAAAAGAEEPQNPVPIPMTVPDPVNHGAVTAIPAPSARPDPGPGGVAAPGLASPSASTAAAASPAAPPSAPLAAAAPSPVAPAPWPPQFSSPQSRLNRDGFLIGFLLTLLLVGAIAVALTVARRRRHFAHVEEVVDWPPHGVDQVVEPRPVAAAGPTGVEFRKQCAAALSRAGWVTQLAFPGDGSGPDIVARRDAAVAAVRCRASNTAVTGEMVDEAAIMGSRHGATLTLLASNAPFSQRARDEAVRHGILLLRDWELAGFVG